MLGRPVKCFRASIVLLKAMNSMDFPLMLNGKGKTGEEKRERKNGRGKTLSTSKYILVFFFFTKWNNLIMRYKVNKPLNELGVSEVNGPT